MYTYTDANTIPTRAAPNVGPTLIWGNKEGIMEVILSGRLCANTFNGKVVLGDSESTLSTERPS